MAKVSTLHARASACSACCMYVVSAHNLHQSRDSSALQFVAGYVLEVLLARYTSCLFCAGRLVQRAVAHVIPHISPADGATAAHAHLADRLRGRRMVTTTMGSSSAKKSRLRHLRSANARAGHQAKFRAAGTGLLRANLAVPDTSSDGALWSSVCVVPCAVWRIYKLRLWWMHVHNMTMAYTAAAMRP